VSSIYWNFERNEDIWQHGRRLILPSATTEEEEEEEEDTRRARKQRMRRFPKHDGGVSAIRKFTW